MYWQPQRCLHEGTGPMARPERKLPAKDSPEWDLLVNQLGLTDGEIGARFGVSRQFVSRERPLPPAEKPAAIRTFLDHIPQKWEVRWRDRDHPLFVALRNVARMYAGAEPEDFTALEMREFLDHMQDARLPDGEPIGRGVVIYRPDAPEPGERFLIVPWRPGDLEFSRPRS